MAGTLYITGDTAADKLLNTNANALLLGMLLDQQVPMEWAFTGPVDAQAAPRSPRPEEDRRDGRRRVRVDLLREAGDPPLPRLDGQAHPRRVRRRSSRTTRATPPTSGRTSTTATRSTGACRRCPATATRSRRSSSPSSARPKASSLDGWREAAGKFGDDTPRSVADVHDEVSLGKVRDWKKAQKAAKKDKQDRPT